MINSSVSKKINIFCLVAVIISVLVFPLKKEIWYDETVSMLCSKGFSHDTPLMFANTSSVSSETLGKLNTATNVFNATVIDNSNSFLFNIGLHYFTMLFGNGIPVSMLFSKFCGIAALIAFYFLCDLFFEGTLFTSLAIILLAADNTFMGMSHEIRAYSMGMFFVIIAAIYFFKFIYRAEKPLYLFLTGLFSVGAILSHFLSVYIILVFLAWLLIKKKLSLFSFKNIIALLIPVSILILFFYCSFRGLQIMNSQSHVIQQKTIAGGFSLREVLFRSMKYFAINFSVVFPAFINKNIASIISGILIIILYIFGLKSTTAQAEKRNLHLLFILGISGSVFLALLSIISRHYTALYFRYYSFCIPFAILFTSYLIFILFKNPKTNKLFNLGIFLIILLPSCGISLIFNLKTKPKLSYNYNLIASRTVAQKILKIEVPEWQDAFMLQCLLPHGYKIDYVLNPTSPYFTLYTKNTTEQVLAIKSNT